MIIEVPYKIINNYQTVVFFTDVFEQTKKCYAQDITFDLKLTKVFESNMFSVLGCLISTLEQNRNRIAFTNIPDSIQNLFNTKKMEEGKTVKNAWKLLIKCQRLGAGEEELIDYMEQRIFPERTAVELNPQLKMAIQLCVAESFRNAFTHAGCHEVFIAHYFSIHNKKLRITIVDKGKSIKQAIAGKHHSNNSIDAVNWAVKPNNTSDISGEHKGIGLPTIRQFIAQNEGKIKIISGNAVWKQVKHRIFSKLQTNNFPGTIITLEFAI